MTAKLLQADLDLLNDLGERGGNATISGNKQRDGADRLVAAGFANSHSLNISDLHYEITEFGRTLLAAKKYGLPDDISAIEPQRSDIDGLWRVRVSSPNKGALLMELGYATKLVDQI